MFGKYKKKPIINLNELAEALASNGPTTQFFQELEELILTIATDPTLAEHSKTAGNLYREAIELAAKCATETAAFIFCQISNAQRSDLEIFLIQNRLWPIVDDLSLCEFIEDMRTEYKLLLPKYIVEKLERLFKMKFIDQQTLNDIMQHQESSAQEFNLQFKKLLDNISAEEVSKQKEEVAQRILSLQKDAIEFQQSIIMIADSYLTELDNLMIKIANEEVIELENYSNTVVNILSCTYRDFDLKKEDAREFLSEQLNNHHKIVDNISLIMDVIHINQRNKELNNQINLFLNHNEANDSLINAFENLVRYILNQKISDQFSFDNPTWHAYAEHYNRVTKNITSEIKKYTQSSPKQALMACERQIAILKICLENYDFFNAYAIYNTLYTLPFVQILFGGKDRPNLSNASRDIMEQAEALFMMDGNFQNYKNHTRDMDQYLPIPSIISSDLTFLKEGNKAENLGSFCFSLCKQISMLREFARLQARARTINQNSLSTSAENWQQSIHETSEIDHRHDPDNNNALPNDKKAKKKQATLNKKSGKIVCKAITQISLQAKSDFPHNAATIKQTKYPSFRFKKTDTSLLNEISKLTRRFSSNHFPSTARASRQLIPHQLQEEKKDTKQLQDNIDPAHQATLRK